MSHCRHHIFSVAIRWMQLVSVLLASSLHAQINDWINPGNGNWDNAANWSAGLPNATQSEVRIVNTNSKAVAIQSGTPAGSMTVQNLRVGGVLPNTNLLLMNFFGTTPPLRVLNNFNIEPNGRVLMLSSGLNVSNMLHLQGLFEQESGELVFSNSLASIMQIEGGRFNLTNGYVFGRNLYLGGANEGFVNASGLVAVDWLVLGSKPSVPGSTGAGTYVLQNGWLIVGEHELVGGNGFGTLVQLGGTNSAPDLAVGNGFYLKNGGALFAGELRVISSSGTMTHAGGTATVTNVLRLNGQGSQISKFNMLGGSLVTPRIQLEQAARFTQSNGTVNVASELFIDDDRNEPSTYALAGGNLFANKTTITSTPGTGFDQSGGTHIVTNQLIISSATMYRMSGGTLSAPSIVLSANLSFPAQFFVVGAPPFVITNESVGANGGAFVIQDSAQRFGRLTIEGDSGVNLAGSSAILRFADSHTNLWQSGLIGVVPQLLVFNWDGSTFGGGADQLTFGTSSSALTSSQLAQIKFINPTGFPPGTNSARILATGEVVPMPQPVLSVQNDGTNLVLSWPESFFLQSATNVAGPYLDVEEATSPHTVTMNERPMEFFRLRN